MSYREALSLFNLEDKYTEKELKNKYNKLTKKKDIDLEKINLVYDILSAELMKRKMKELRDKWLFDISKLKDKYIDTKIYNFCLSYENKIENISNYKDLNELKDKFNQEISNLKNEIALPIEKNKIIKKINRYIDGYSKEVIDLANNYSNLIFNSISFEELNTLKQKFNVLIKEELKQEKGRKEEFKKIKDNLLNSSISKFYEYSRENNLNNIIYAHNELILILSILNKAKIDTMDKISNLIDKLNYKDIEIEYNDLKKFYFELINKDDYEFEKIKTDKNKKENELITLVLDKYFLYLTNKNTKFEKIIQNEQLFKDILLKINEIDSTKKNVLYKFISNESYKDIKIVLEILDDFKEPNKIYIERETGEICVINSNYKKIYSVNLDGTVKNNIEKKQDIFWNFINIVNFFDLSKYTNGFEVKEVYENDEIELGDYDINYLYYTDKLILCLSEKNAQEEFKFIPAKSGYRYEISENSQITRNDNFNKYKDKKACLNDILIYINNRLYKSDNIE